MKKLFVTLLLICAVAAQEASAQKKNKTRQTERKEMALTVPTGTMTFAGDGYALSFCRSVPSVQSPGKTFWTVEIERTDAPDRRHIICSEGQTYETAAVKEGFRITYPKLSGEGREWNISVTIDYAVRDGKMFEVSPRIENGEQEWVVTSFTGPVIDGLQTDLSDFPLYMPVGVGFRYDRAPTKEEPLNKLTQKGAVPWKWIEEKERYELIYPAGHGEPYYPSRFATMQWCTFSGAEGGLYLASHDETHAAKRFSVRYEPSTNTMGFAFVNCFTCFGGESHDVPATLIWPYEGSWHQCGDLYRAWFDTSVEIRNVPQWVHDSSGWLLTILKQQNDEIMWPYETLGTELSDIAEAHGLNIIGLFGWAHGGHDRFYPDYHPDPAMGGREELVKALALVRRRGLRSIIYANGQLIDQHGTDYWDETGKHITVVKNDASLDYQKWHKYSDAPARYHGMACLGCTEWYDRMLFLAEQANELGADGILYDQLAVTAPKYCYSPDHGHTVPAVVYENDRYKLLRRIADHMTAVNPDFVIMTEGLVDVEQDAIAMYHGYANGLYVPTQTETEQRYRGTAAAAVFPEMFMYTFPENITTVRNPSPVNNRLILNYGTAHGLRNELESRYAADVRYLKEGRTPVPEDYHNVLSKPDLRLVTSQDPEAMLLYTRQVIDFQQEYKDLLWEGRFRDTEGFLLDADKDIVAKSFFSGDRLGVLVWNINDGESRGFTVNPPAGYRLEKVAAPDDDKPSVSEPLAPQSIRLLIYTK